LARDNYSHQKYKKELARKKKKERKMQRKLDKKNLKASEEQGPVLNPVDDHGENVETT